MQPDIARSASVSNPVHSSNDEQFAAPAGGLDNPQQDREVFRSGSSTSVSEGSQSFYSEPAGKASPETGPDRSRKAVPTRRIGELLETVLSLFVKYVT